jgi:hypothetical protein
MTQQNELSKHFYENATDRALPDTDGLGETIKANRGLRLDSRYFALKDAHQESVLNVPKNQQKNLFQDKPRDKNDPKYIETVRAKGLPDNVDYCSYTHSYESYKCAADKYAAILETNDRLPTKQILWKLLREDLTAPEIMRLRNGVFRYLRNKGLEAITNIELTRDPFKNPTNRVHFHILTDDPRNEDELQNLFIKPCKRRRLVECVDFTISCTEITAPKTIFDYFTKRTRTDRDECAKMGWNRVLLFVPKFRIQKFREIKSKNGMWFRKKIDDLWKEFKEKKHGKGNG